MNQGEVFVPSYLLPFSSSLRTVPSKIEKQDGREINSTEVDRTGRPRKKRMLNERVTEGHYNMTQNGLQKRKRSITYIFHPIRSKKHKFSTLNPL